MEQCTKSAWVGIAELTQSYLPLSKKRARAFALLYLNVKRVGNRIFVERKQLEQLLADPDREAFPLYM